VFAVFIGNVGKPAEHEIVNNLAVYNGLDEIET
jgi:hypothetical protein